MFYFKDLAVKNKTLKKRVYFNKVIIGFAMQLTDYNNVLKYF